MTPKNSDDFRTALELPFPILSDAGNTTSRRYGLVFTLPTYVRPVFQKFGIDLPQANGDESFELPVPATYVIDRDGTVRWAHVNLDYRTRAEPAEIVKALKSLSK